LARFLNECGWTVEPDNGKMSLTKIFGRLVDIIFPLFILIWILAVISIIVAAISSM